MIFKVDDDDYALKASIGAPPHHRHFGFSPGNAGMMDHRNQRTRSHACKNFQAEFQDQF